MNPLAQHIERENARWAATASPTQQQQQQHHTQFSELARPLSASLQQHQHQHQQSSQQGRHQLNTKPQVGGPTGTHDVLRMSYSTSAFEDYSEGSSYYDEDDCETVAPSLFSAGAVSRRSSVTSMAPSEFADDVQVLAFPGLGQLQHQLQQQQQQQPPRIYASLEAAVAASLQNLDGEPRRLVTPGKLYENEEDDDA